MATDRQAGQIWSRSRLSVRVILSWSALSSIAAWQAIPGKDEQPVTGSGVWLRRVSGSRLAIRAVGME